MLNKQTELEDRAVQSENFAIYLSQQLVNGVCGKKARVYFTIALNVFGLHSNMCYRFLQNLAMLCIFTSKSADCKTAKFQLLNYKPFLSALRFTQICNISII